MFQTSSPVPQGVLHILNDGDEIDFWGFEIFDSGIFWVGKCGKYFIFLGGLIKVGGSYSKQSEDSW